MAKALVALRVGFALVVGLAVAGCQQSKSTIVAKLPAPNLDGPQIAAPAPIAKAAPATRPAAAAHQSTDGQRRAAGGISHENVPHSGHARDRPQRNQSHRLPGPAYERRRSETGGIAVSRRGCGAAGAEEGGERGVVEECGVGEG